MNLIYDAWIPVRRASGKKGKITPFMITDKNDSILELAAPRPDFNGALIQFLIGLLQTTCAPESKAQWRDWLRNPPTPVELKSKFDTVAFAFNLDGDGPRFMQEVGLSSKGPKRIEMLLFGSPQENTIELNRDFFIKRDRTKVACCDCIAVAIFTLQLNAPANSYLRSGVRFGGPISTIIKDHDLWSTIWINIFQKGDFERLGNVGFSNFDDKFPWLKKDFSSDGRPISIQDIHPSQMYWAMPRRLRILFDKSDNTLCDLCGDKRELIAKEYIEMKYGINYTGFFPHPLCPTKVWKDNTVSPVKTQGELSYKHWLGYVLASANERERITPARIVVQRANDNCNLDLWAFGYEMKNMNILCWREGVMPIIGIEEDKRQMYEAEVTTIIRIAEEIVSSLRWAVRSAFFSRPKEKGDVRAIGQRFWQETESDFYRLISNLREAILADRDAVSVKEEWHKCLTRKAERIFDDVSQSEMIDEVDVKRVAQAWNKMKWNIHSKKIRQELGLP